MFKVKCEKYYDDNHRNNFEKIFNPTNPLKELEEWIFQQMKQKYEGNMWFCAEGLDGMVPAELTEPAIHFMPEPGLTYYIHEIIDDDYIIFSDGAYTSGLKYCSNNVKEWLKHCRNRQYSPIFNFGDKTNKEEINMEINVAKILKETRGLSQNDRLSLLCKVMEDALCDPEATREDIDDDEVVDMYDSMQSMYEAVGEYLARA